MAPPDDCGHANCPKCCGLGCSSADLIEAHIIPRSFARDIKESSGPNKRISPTSSGTSKQQLGEFDPNILCATCDGRLGRFDDYAIEICRTFSRDRIDLGEDLFELRDFAGDRFAKFVLAILWRASISKRDSFRTVNLGPYEAKARDVLFGAKPLASLPQFALIVERYRSRITDSAKFYFHPVRHKIGKWNSYVIGLGGFRLTAKLSNEPFPSEFETVIVNATDVLRGWYVDFEATSEFKVISNQVRAHAKKAQAAPER